MHGATDTVEHEPCGFLGYVQRPCNLARTNTVLRAGNNPDGREPFPKAKRGIVEDGFNLRGELTLGMAALALPLFLHGKVAHVATSASGASNSIGPAVRDHKGNAVIGTSEGG